MTITADERELIARWIVPDERGPQEAWVREHGVSAWALIGYWKGVDRDTGATAQAYDLPPEAVEAMLALYRYFGAYIDAKLLLNEASDEDLLSIFR